jgi:flagellar motor switch protein FliM
MADQIDPLLQDLPMLTLGDGFGAPGQGEGDLDQAKIDSLFGFGAKTAGGDANPGLRAIIDSVGVSYERLPMLEMVFDRLVRLLTNSLRNFTSENVEVSIDQITSVRFGNYIDGIPLPAILAIVKANPWDNYGIVTVDSSLLYTVVDLLLGGRRRGGAGPTRIEGRPYTAIEHTLLKSLLDVVLADTERAFAPLSPVTFTIDQFETNPRFVTIARPANAALLVRFRIEMESRGGGLEFLLPYSTIEPIRDVLLNGFMGEKFGRDQMWEEHLATEIWSAKVDLSAVLFEEKMPLGRIMGLKVGDTLMLEVKPDALVGVKCNGLVLTEARMGRAGDAVAVQVAKPLVKSQVTLAAFEGRAGN